MEQVIKKRIGLIQGENRAYLTSTDRVSEVGRSSSNFGAFSGAIPSLASTISSRLLASVSLRCRSFDHYGGGGNICRIWTYSL